MAGDLQTDLVGAGRKNELTKVGSRSLPAEPAEAAILRRFTRPRISGNSGNLLLCRKQDLFRDCIDPPYRTGQADSAARASCRS